MRLPWRQSSAYPIWTRGFPFYLAKPRSAVERLRASSARQVWQDGSIWKRTVSAGVMAGVWPIVTFVQAAKAGRTIASETGAAFLPNVFKLYVAALGRNIAPPYYAKYAIVSSPDHPPLADLLLEPDHRTLTKLGRARGADFEDVQDKVCFARICEEHGLPCVPTIASFSRGSSTGEQGLREWPHAIFVKALTGNRGAGAERWRRSGRDFVSSTGVRLNVEQLISEFRHQNCIVQPLIEDCEALRELGSVALSSLRVVTVKGWKTPATAIAALFCLADGPDSMISHMGTFCGIDVETGVIVQAGPVRLKAGESRKPALDALDGAKLPYWNQTVDLVRRAHDEAFSAFVTLGWDIALTADGPILLETNATWAIAGHQFRTGPLGRTALADVIDELLSAPPDLPSAHQVT